MKLIHYFILFAVSFTQLTQSFSSTYSMERFEVVVTETLPESMNLNMTLDEITAAKHVSRVAETKKKIYSFILNNLNPLISKHSLSQDMGLFEIASELPINTLIEDIMTFQKNSSTKLPPADFMIAVFPKVPRSEAQENLIAYESLYSPKKASVIDNKNKGFLPQKKYSKSINDRIGDSFLYAFNRNYIELKSNLPFFAGALLNIHIEGPASWGRLQLMAGLPTGKAQDFVQDVPEANFTHFKSPSIPTYESIEYNDLPGGIIDLTIKPGTENPAILKVKFGNLGKLQDRSWEAANTPVAFDEQWGTSSLGLVGFRERFNVPHLFGTPKALAGKGWIDNYINRNHFIRMNIHEVEINLTKFEITNIRVTVDLPERDDSTSWLTPLKHYTLEQPDASAQFIAEGNKVIQPLKEKAQRIMETSPEEFLTNHELRGELLTLLIDLINEKKTNGGSK